MSELRNKMVEDMCLNGYSKATQKLYLQKVIAYANFFHKSPADLGPDEIRRYLLYLLYDKKLSISAYKHAFHGLKFLYTVTMNREWHIFKIVKPKERRKIPVVLSKEEIKRVLDCIENLKHRTIITTIYSGGLRINEASHLSITDIDSSRMCINIHNGKGDKRRYVPLAKTTLNLLREYWYKYKPRKWLFPGRTPDKPIANRSIQHICEDAYKRAGITKDASVHTLRHSFATHLMIDGVHMRYIQEILGHSSPRTTAIYTHVCHTELAKITNPLDTFNYETNKQN